MSNPLRVAFVVEGPTDYIMLKKIVHRFLEGKDFIPQILQPEMSEAFRPMPGEDGGWPGVCRWCLQVVEQSGGHLSDNPLFVSHDILIIHIDADVAGFSYGDGHIQDPFPGHPTLPFNEPCPPASATTDRLRSVVLRWIGEQHAPRQTVLCTPSKALEAWVLVGIFPNDNIVRAGNIECREEPEAILRGKPLNKRLVSGNRKNVDKYEEYAPDFAANWNIVKGQCTEAVRFEDEFKAALANPANGA